METKPEKEEWKSYSLEEYREVAAAMVHFSFKGVNSNADAGGVRLKPDDELDLPYVSARCLLARKIVLDADYTKNAGHTATVVKQIGKLATDEHGESPANADRIRAVVAEALTPGHETGTESISPRHRQILLPFGQSDYLAITPLPAGGLSRLIKSRVKAHNDLATEVRKQAVESNDATAQIPRQLRLATLGVGGANPQNVGALVRDMQTPLVFGAPTENPALRDAYRIHYNGIPIRLPYRPMLAWRAWRDQATAANAGFLPTGLEARETEKGLLLAAAQAVIRSGVEALRLLEIHRGQLPGGELLSSSMEDTVIRGLIVPSQREKDWPRAFGKRVAEEMGRYAPDHQGVLVSLNSEALSAIAGWIEEAVR